MIEDVSFGQVVKDHRTALGLTQTELARRVGCAAITIRKIEAGDLRPSVQMAELIALALNIPDEEQLAFVRLARADRAPSPIPTPSPAPGEIGMADLSGRAVKGFQLGEKIGSGGFGVVYRALQPSVERDVAVKIILPRYANHPNFIRRFEAEAQLIARLEHPHIVPLYDYWREPNAAYLIMRFLRGGSLQDQLKDGPISVELVRQYIRQIGLALDVAHRNGVIHRDIKPANVLLDEESNAYLADFGIAKNLEGIDGQSLTEESALIGSPAYISPEQIKAEPVKPPSDIYCLGIMLYEILTGNKPFSGPTPVAFIQQHLNESLPSLQDYNPDLPPELDLIIRQATAKNPADRFQDVPSLLIALERIWPIETGIGTPLRPETPIVELGTEELATLENPYKGLRAFSEADADQFYGRATLIQELFTKLSEHSDLSRFLAIVGPSGGGKSSLARAGLVPALRRGGLPRSENWFALDFTPGAQPWEEVEAALLRIAVNPPESLLGQLQDGDRGLLRAVRRILPDDGQTELVLVIDQFEEIFTLVEDEAIREHFLNSLVTAVLDDRSRLRVVITLRADFYDRPLQYVDFGDLMRQRTVSVLPMTPDELEQAIVRPAARVGVRLESGLAASIIADVGDQPGALPLMQYALTELFERRDQNVMTRAAYQEAGGVAGALARRADEIYEGLAEDGRAAARQLFLRLVTLGDGEIETGISPDTRRRVLLSEIESLQASEFSENGNGFNEVINPYGHYRLLTFDYDPVTRAPTVEVAHEALLREWGRLRGWLDESRNDVRMQRVLAQAAREWEGSGRDPGFLPREARLDQFTGWAAGSNVALTGNEKDFLEASIKAREARLAEEESRRQREVETAKQLADTESKRAEEQAQAAGRLRQRGYILAGMLVVVALLAVAALFFANQSSQNAQNAQLNAQEAQDNAQLAATREAEAVTQAEQRATAQTQAENERLRADEQRDAALEAESEAVNERAIAEEQALLARSRELAAASTSSQTTDPELSMLLALEALSTADTAEAQNALHAAVLGSRIRQRLTAHKSPIDGITYSPDGSLIAMGSSGDSTTSVWNATTGERVFDVPINTFAGVSFMPVNLSPDGARLATVDPGDDLSLSYWDTATGGRLERISLPIPTAGMTRYHLNPDWTQLAVGYEGGAATIWDLDSGQLFAELAGHTDFVEPYYSPDGRWLATASDGAILVWDTATASLVRRLDTGGPAFFVSMSPDGRWLAFGDPSNAVQVWDLEAPGDGTDQAPTTTLTGHGNFVFGLAFNPDSQLIATAGLDSTARLWDLSTGENLLTFPQSAPLPSLAFHPDGDRLLAGDREGNALVWDLTPQGSAERLTWIAHDGLVREASISPGGNTLATASYDGTAKIWDMATGQELQVLDGHLGRVLDVIFHPGGKRLATAGEDRTARVWDVETGQELLKLEGHGEGMSSINPGVLAVAYSPDGARLATAGADGTARIWDATTGEALQVLRGHMAGLTNVVYSPDGRYLATVSGSGDNTARIWDADTGQEQFVLPIGHDGQMIYGLDLSPDGRFLATSGQDQTARIWGLDYQAKGGELLATLTAHTNTVLTVRFAPDGKSLATATSQEVRLWDLSTLDSNAAKNEVPELLTLAGGAGTGFRPEASELITAGGDGLVHVYLLDPGNLMALARSRLTRTWTAEECRQYRIQPCPVE